MVDGFYKSVAKLLTTHQFYRVDGGKGSHEKWIDDAGTTLTVPRNLMSRHTANGILKSAGVSKRL
jgi:predicted RNA binding protein YcfA (HicA-like mRNA interferase family)